MVLCIIIMHSCNRPTVYNWLSFTHLWTHALTTLRTEVEPLNIKSITSWGVVAQPQTNIHICYSNEKFQKKFSRVWCVRHRSPVTSLPVPNFTAVARPQAASHRGVSRVSVVCLCPRFVLFVQSNNVHILFTICHLITNDMRYLQGGSRIFRTRHYVSNIHIYMNFISDSCPQKVSTPKLQTSKLIY